MEGRPHSAYVHYPEFPEGSYNSENFPQTGLDAAFLPQTLVPLVIYNNRRDFVKATLSRPATAVVPSTGPTLNTPLYLKESATVKTFSRQLNKFAEPSLYHREQILGKGSTANLRPKRLPKMRADFVPKAALDREQLAKGRKDTSDEIFYIPSGNGPQDENGGKRTNRLRSDENNRTDSARGKLKPISNQQIDLSGLQDPTFRPGSGNPETDSLQALDHQNPGFDGNNTLSYSQTLVSGMRKTENSPFNTVFGVTTRFGAESKDTGQESARFGGNLDGSMDAGSKNQTIKSQTELLKSELVLLSDQAKADDSRSKTLQGSFGISKVSSEPLENHVVWFQFYNAHVYASLASLILIMDGVEYRIPFGLSKQILMSRDVLELALKSGTFEKDGQYSISPEGLSKIKEKIAKTPPPVSSWVKTDNVFMIKKEIRLILPSAKIYLRAEKRWISRLLDREEMMSLTPELDPIKLKGCPNVDFTLPFNSTVEDKFSNLQGPYHRTEIPNYLTMKAFIESLDLVAFMANKDRPQTPPESQERGQQRRSSGDQDEVVSRRRKDKEMEDSERAMNLALDDKGHKDFDEDGENLENGKDHSENEYDDDDYDDVGGPVAMGPPAPIAPDAPNLPPPLAPPRPHGPPTGDPNPPHRRAFDSFGDMMVVPSGVPTGPPSIPKSTVSIPPHAAAQSTYNFKHGSTQYTLQGLVIKPLPDSPPPHIPHQLPLSLVANLKDVPLGKGGEDDDCIALEAIVRYLINTGSIVGLEEDFNVIPDTKSYLVMQGTQERYYIQMPMLTGGPKPRKVQLAQLRDAIQSRTGLIQPLGLK